MKVKVFGDLGADVLERQVNEWLEAARPRVVSFEHSGYGLHLSIAVLYEDAGAKDEG